MCRHGAGRDGRQFNIQDTNVLRELHTADIDVCVLTRLTSSPVGSLSAVPLRVSSCSFLRLSLGGVNYVQREIYRAEGSFIRLTINQSKLTLVMSRAAHRGGKKGAISWEARERQKK